MKKQKGKVDVIFSLRETIGELEKEKRAATAAYNALNEAAQKVKMMEKRVERLKAVQAHYWPGATEELEKAEKELKARKKSLEALKKKWEAKRAQSQ